MQNKILVIEDDKWISTSLKLYLENSNFIVDLYETWHNAVEKILDWNYDLIVLDINLPIKNWIEICDEVRETSNIPIIMLTARSWEIDKIFWLEKWADDYISKPFSPRELLARINAILRRISKKINSNIIEYDEIKLDLDKAIATIEEKNINLTKNEFDILKKIIQEDWKIVKRETLMTEIIWYKHYAYDRTIDTHIKNIRKKISPKDFILTIRWQWYRINK